MGQILLLSNGHGEDVSGALIGQALQSLGHHVQALPLAGLGSPYRQAGIAMLGRSHEFSTCLLYTSPSPRDMRRSRMPSSA